MENSFDIEDSFFDYFSVLTDPRTDINIKHKLIDIVTIALCAVVCDCDGWEDIEDFAIERESWFKTFLELPHGIPSHDRIRAVFIHLDPVEFESCFRNWVGSLIKTGCGTDFVSIDGKTSRGSFDNEKNINPIHIVSAWAHGNNLVLGQVKTSEKSNEITAIPELIKTLNLKGSVVTIDAVACQKKIVQGIIEKNADYIIGLKGNQKTLHERSKKAFEKINVKEISTIKDDESRAHGRTEQREYSMIKVPGSFNEGHTWAGFNSIGSVKSTRLVNEKISEETRYYITSLTTNDIHKFAVGVRSHWSIENKLHWQLDVSFGEDQCRKRIANAALNMSLLRRIALNLCKKETSRKISMRRKRKIASYSLEYMKKILLGI
jgi:predicted transposase YbfD/YdcC